MVRRWLRFRQRWRARDLHRLRHADQSIRDGCHELLLAPGGGELAATQSPAPAYENGWNAINQFIREDCSWNGREPNVLYARRGGRYYDYSGVSGIDFADDSRAFAVTDFDGDGNLDLFSEEPAGAAGPRSAQRMGNRTGERIAIRLTGVRGRIAMRLAPRWKWSSPAGVPCVRAGRLGLSFATYQDAAFRIGRCVRAPKGSRSSGLPGCGRSSAISMRDFVITSRRETANRAASRFAAPRTTSAAPRSRRTIGRLLKRRGCCFPFRFPSSGAARASFCSRPAEAWRFPPGIPGEVLDLSRESPDVAAGYALFRRYLFDYRAELLLPMLILIDEFGLAHKVYPAVPGESRLRRICGFCERQTAQRLALPFPRPILRTSQRAIIFGWARRSFGPAIRSRRWST